MSLTTLGTTPASSQGKAVVAGNGSKGSYVEMVASTAADYKYLYLFVANPTDSEDALIDIATGAASSEVVKVPDLLFDHRVGMSAQYALPYEISSGTRVAIRIEATGAATFYCTLVMADANSRIQEITSVVATAYGANSGSTPVGTSVDPGATINTKGSYAQLVASTGDDIKQFLIMVGNQGNIGPTGGSWLLDLATGAAASETDVVDDLPLQSYTSYHGPAQVFGPFALDISSGTRLSVRAQCSINDATDRLLNVVVLGLDGTVASGGAADSRLVGGGLVG
jgi:hypothetical protein